MQWLLRLGQLKRQWSHFHYSSCHSNHSHTSPSHHTSPSAQRTIAPINKCSGPIHPVFITTLSDVISHWSTHHTALHSHQLQLLHFSVLLQVSVLSTVPTLQSHIFSFTSASRYASSTFSFPKQGPFSSSFAYTKAWPFSSSLTLTFQWAKGEQFSSSFAIA